MDDQTLQRWAAIATILALIVAILHWLDPEHRILGWLVRVFIVIARAILTISGAVAAILQGSFVFLSRTILFILVHWKIAIGVAMVIVAIVFLPSIMTLIAANPQPPSPTTTALVGTTSTPKPNPTATPLPPSISTATPRPTNTPPPTSTPDRIALLWSQLDPVWGDWPRSIAILEQLRSLTPNDSKVIEKLYVAHFNYGQALEKAGDKTGAITEYLAGLKLKPNGAEASTALLNLTPTPTRTPSPPTLTPTFTPPPAPYIVIKSDPPCNSRVLSRTRFVNLGVTTTGYLVGELRRIWASPFALAQGFDPWSTPLLLYNNEGGSFVGVFATSYNGSFNHSVGYGSTQRNDIDDYYFVADVGPGPSRLRQVCKFTVEIK